MDFYDLDLNDNVLDALDDMNFTECTPIQEHAIPVILEGKDLIGVAQTGTGKTAAYLLPVLSRMCDYPHPEHAINCVIMSPTRELAQQIDQAIEGFSYYMPISSVAVYGGNDGIRYEQEKKGLAMGADIIIATPGRLISHLSLGNVDLSQVSYFILDEADRMLDMGFSEDIMQIEKHLSKNRQTIMFSATMPPKIQDLARTILHDPVEIKLAVSRPADKIDQSAFICYEAQKLKIVKSLFKNETPKRVIIFASSKQKVKDMAIALQQAGYSVGAMHSDLEQSERDDVMHKFKTQQIDVLVATDIVARGIDIDDIQLVINYDVPHDAEDYVHRIGRTARANNDGMAITLVSEKDQVKFQSIERFLKMEVRKRDLPKHVGDGPEYTVKTDTHDKKKKRRKRNSNKSAGAQVKTDKTERKMSSGSQNAVQNVENNATETQKESSGAAEPVKKKRKRSRRKKAKIGANTPVMVVESDNAQGGKQE